MGGTVCPLSCGCQPFRRRLALSRPAPTRSGTARTGPRRWEGSNESPPHSSRTHPPFASIVGISQWGRAFGARWPAPSAAGNRAAAPPAGRATCSRPEPTRCRCARRGTLMRVLSRCVNPEGARREGESSGLQVATRFPAGSQVPATRIEAPTLMPRFAKGNAHVLHPTRSSGAWHEACLSIALLRAHPPLQRVDRPWPRAGSHGAPGGLHTRRASDRCRPCGARHRQPGSRTGSAAPHLHLRRKPQQ